MYVRVCMHMCWICVDMCGYVCMYVCTYLCMYVHAYVCTMHACNVPVRKVSMYACIYSIILLSRHFLTVILTSCGVHSKSVPLFRYE